MREELALRTIDSRVKKLPLLGIVRVLLFSAHVLLFLTLHSFLFILIRNEKVRLRMILRSNAFHAGIALKYLGIETLHDEEISAVRGKLLICNHLSYLDALILFHLYPSLFITSKEIERTPVLGAITKLGGCFFIERRKNLRTEEIAQQELRLMRKKLSEGFNIFLFPEGTSSDGSGVLPFKAHFFQLAIDTGASVLPLSLKYHGENRRAAPWYGDMSFLPHFFRVCNEKGFTASVRQLPKVSPGIGDRFSLKDEVQKIVNEAYETH